MTLLNVHLSDTGIEIKQELLFAYNIHRMIFLIEDKSYNDIFTEYYVNKSISEYFQCTSDLLQEICKRFYASDDQQIFLNCFLQPLNKVKRYYSELIFEKSRKQNYSQNICCLYLRKIVRHFILKIIRYKVLSEENYRDFNAVAIRNINGIQYKPTNQSFESILIKHESDYGRIINIYEVEKLKIINEYDINNSIFLIKIDLTNYFFNAILWVMEEVIEKIMLEINVNYNDYNSFLMEEMKMTNELTTKWLNKIIEKLDSTDKTIKIYVFDENMEKLNSFIEIFFGYLFMDNEKINELLTQHLINDLKSLYAEIFKKYCSEITLKVKTIYIYRIGC